MSEKENASSTAGLVERVLELAPLIAEHAEQAERERKPVDKVIAALAETGVFKALEKRGRKKGDAFIFSVEPQRTGGYLKINLSRLFYGYSCPRAPGAVVARCRQFSHCRKPGFH